MSNNSPRPNDFAPKEDRLKKTISNMEAAEEALQFAEGKELERIEAKNKRRKNSIENMKDELEEEKEPKFNRLMN